MLTDTHCHLFYDDMKNDLPAVLDRAAELGVNRFICVATNMEDARDCLLLSETYDNVFASAGVHPHDAKDVTEDYIEQIYYLMTFDSMVAVGEMGLDYFRNISDPVTQIRVFREQMSIAQEMDKDLIVTSVYRGENKLSTHKYYRAFDFRVQPSGGESIYTPEEIEKIKRFCEHFIYSSNPKKYKFKTLRVHGPVMHGHVQCNAEGVTELA